MKTGFKKPDFKLMNNEKTHRYQTCSSNGSKKETVKASTKLVSELCNKTSLGKFINNRSKKKTGTHE